MDPTSIQEAKYKTQAFFAITRDTFEAGFAKLRREETAALDVAIIKATFQDELPPKEKHVQTLIKACSASSEGDNTTTYIIHGLVKRLEENAKAWLVTLKTLIVFHRLLREADAVFCEKLKTYAEGTGQRDLFRLEAFNDDTTKDTLSYSAFVRAYSIYLDERFTVFRSFAQFDPVRDAEATARETKLKSTSAADLLARLPTLQRMLDGLLACAPKGAAESHEVSVFAATLVLNELGAVYGISFEGVQVLIAKAAELTDPDDALKVVLTVKEAVSLNEKLRAYEDAINVIPKLQGVVKFPEEQVLAADILPNLEAYLQNPSRLDGQGPEKTPVSVADLLGCQSFLVSAPPAAAPPAAEVAQSAVDIFSSFHAPTPPEVKPEPTDPLEILAALVVPPPTAVAEPAAAAEAAAPADTAVLPTSTSVATEAPAKAFTFGDDNPFSSEPLPEGSAPLAAGTAVAAEVKPAEASVTSAKDEQVTPAAAPAPLQAHATGPAPSPVASKAPAAAAPLQPPVPPSGVSPAATFSSPQPSATAAPPPPAGKSSRNVSPSPSARYALKGPDPLDDITEQLLGKQEPPPKVPMNAISMRKDAPAADKATTP